MGGSWGRFEEADMEAIVGLARRAEPRHVNMTHRFLERGDGESWKPAFRGGKRGFLAVKRDGESLRGAILFHPHGVVAPCLPEACRGDGDRLARLLEGGSFHARSAIGFPAELDLACSVVGRRPDLQVRYRFMSLGTDRAIPHDDRGEVRVRWAVERDLDEAYPLRERYEREEVVTSIHSFDPAACKRALSRIIADGALALAFLDGIPVGTAAINGRGVSWEQIGGVYVDPKRRGRGVARALMGFLASESRGRGMGSCLFVKTANDPAKNLYHSLGFEDLGPFEIRYFM
jgi:ribosomal protein S18 acetylase RimI-like enzyme